LQNKYQEYPPKVDAYEHLNHKRAHNYYLCEQQVDNDHRLKKVQPNGTSKDMKEFNLKIL